MKKILSLIISFAIIITSCSFLIGSVSAGTSEALEFPCGLNATAYLDRENGTLTVKGTGHMEFFRETRAPWWAYRQEIKNVIVEEGITQIANVAFLDTKLEKITLPSTLEKIGADALSMTDLEEIVIPENSKLLSCYVSSYFRNIP